ncbi:uncharacterized protein [Triticum aestivum]|uniref:Uncharacterized protein n=4 Tax=Triticinae TaxID=1648030 RepID=A0A452ZW08_AEGTS|nr:uncharacterized protein LOC109782571 [Aegilops tauschii subsp. strangulata]XP_044446595.1 uncharacterized protein LOC123176463 [Triticum aestivum]
MAMAMAKACVVCRVVLVVCALLLLSSTFVVAEATFGQLDHGRKATVAATAMATRRFVRKLLREEVVQADDDGVVDIGGSKRKSPGGPDPQHH